MDLGTTVYVDASDFSSYGPEALLGELLSACNLERDVVTWIQDASLREGAAKRAAWARAHWSARAMGTQTPESSA
jgi:hypothetical protein